MPDAIISTFPILAADPEDREVIFANIPPDAVVVLQDVFPMSIKHTNYLSGIRDSITGSTLAKVGLRRVVQPTAIYSGNIVPCNIPLKSTDFYLVIRNGSIVFPAIIESAGAITQFDFSNIVPLESEEVTILKSEIYII